jgi:hypothetical protein
MFDKADLIHRYTRADARPARAMRRVLGQGSRRVRRRGFTHGGTPSSQS